MYNQQLISIIIPTHNRPESLERLLGGLAAQDYPLHLLEVIVIADGCHKTTGLVGRLNMPYHLQLVELVNQGPAVARNQGAALAKGTLLLFLDDDLEPCPGLVSAHVAAHEVQNRVVIGYLPYKSTKLKGIYITRLRSWWENKFHNMRLPGYRFMYTDLLSGNFSIPADLFRKLNGFAETLRCREDYEIGARLIKAGVDFHFSPAAWATHRDEATDYSRSLVRKRQEGNADVQFGRLHPDLTRNLYFGTYFKKTARQRRLLHLLVFRFPALGAVFAALLGFWVSLLEKAGSRKRWRKYSKMLQVYWYMKGVSDQLPTHLHLRDYLRTYRLPRPVVAPIKIDLRQGLEAAVEEVDRLRPEFITILYGDTIIGTTKPLAGAEPLRGAHLRYELAHTFAWDYMQALALEKLTTSTKPKQDIQYAD